MKETFTEKLIREKHDRERSCFRACAGISDPESMVPEMVRVFTELMMRINVKDNHAESLQSFSEYSTYSKAAREVLSKLKPQGSEAQLTEDGKEGE